METPAAALPAAASVSSCPVAPAANATSVAKPTTSIALRIICPLCPTAGTGRRPCSQTIQRRWHGLPDRVKDLARVARARRVVTTYPGTRRIVESLRTAGRLPSSSLWWCPGAALTAAKSP